jgi:hypothetical protein
MKNTQWQAAGEAANKVKRELSKVIRASLPAIGILNQPGWASGSLLDLDTKQPQAPEEPGAPEEPAQLLQLKTLHWRLLETIDWDKRAAARGVFSGQAWVQADLIDFTGDSVRDLATGAFLEFQLLTMGL